VSEPDLPRGGAYFRGENLIRLNPNRTGGRQPAESVLLFELLRFKYRAKELALDQQAQAGMSKKDYCEKAEHFTFDFTKEHHNIAKDAVKLGQWAAAADRFDPAKRPEYSNFEKYLDHAKIRPRSGGLSHYELTERYYDKLTEP
jgi:hypothetical protein